ncbi:MarR family winged helix-turn-helix transcriptional regulator [Actinoplanes sp. M2I2]|uniref:MarR family winged helix-turn-helix transcriptional regulator n=1 Tax=Actinoplanes sp. M2I2 TaxID=1734444 RepID=UPI00201FC783|nr:MarR family transcriptional regulator [Actinoplanes sp. M2I2]
MSSITPRETAPPHRAGPETSAVPTRWLDDEQQNAWRANAAIMIRLPAALDARMQTEAGLTYFEYMVLSSLSEAEDHTMRMSALAARTSSSLPRLLQVAGRLEKRGLLQRSRVPGSGRRTNATLTDAGYAKVVEAAPRHVVAVREYFIDVLEPGDLAALGRIGAAVGVAIDQNTPGLGAADPPAPASD